MIVYNKISYSSVLKCPVSPQNRTSVKHARDVSEDRGEFVDIHSLWEGE